MDDLELQNLKAVADAVPAVLDLLWSEDYRGDGRVTGLSDALDILRGRNIGNEHARQEYDNGPWATGESDSCPDYPRYELSDWSYTDATGPYRFLAPGVSGKGEPKEPVRIVALKQGFVVSPSDFEDDDLAFTDAFDLADWLLDWMGLEDEKIISVGDIVGGLSEPDEPAAFDFNWRSDSYKRALDVVGAAQAYVEAEGGGMVWAKLVEAVKKWRGIDSEESAKTDAGTQATLCPFATRPRAWQRS